MLMPVIALIRHASARFSLWPGDVVLTGTPSGVGPLLPGDRLSAELHGVLRLRSQVVA
jgi:2-keto-4-pentenoate hydratase/2-oxohepta-3-ene-1,7-dioic acid hydratase in catechol pathway